jgi:SAM-dependent methyltransferase
MNEPYVHGYDPRENLRLQDQASTLAELLHADTSYPAGSRVLEAGCGVGSQTVTLARNSPNALITSIDIEGDHGSAYFYPHSEAAQRAIQCQVELQRRAGGNAMIGRSLYPLLHKAGYTSIRVSPRMVYVDATRPKFVEGFTKKTFTAMIEGIREPALRAGLLERDIFERGIRDLYRTTEPDGVFCYTFFKAFAEK